MTDATRDGDAAYIAAFRPSARWSSYVADALAAAPGAATNAAALLAAHDDAAFAWCMPELSIASEFEAAGRSPWVAAALREAMVAHKVRQHGGSSGGGRKGGSQPGQPGSPRLRGHGGGSGGVSMLAAAVAASSPKLKASSSAKQREALAALAKQVDATTTTGPLSPHRRGGGDAGDESGSVVVDARAALQALAAHDVDDERSPSVAVLSVTADAELDDFSLGAAAAAEPTAAPATPRSSRPAAAAAPPQPSMRRRATAAGIVRLGTVDEMETQRQARLRDRYSRLAPSERAAIPRGEDSDEPLESRQWSHKVGDNPLFRLTTPSERRDIMQRDAAEECGDAVSMIIVEQWGEVLSAIVASRDKGGGCGCGRVSASEVKKWSLAKLRSECDAAGLTGTTGDRKEMTDALLAHSHAAKRCVPTPGHAAATESTAAAAAVGLQFMGPGVTLFDTQAAYARAVLFQTALGGAEGAATAAAGDGGATGCSCAAQEVGCISNVCACRTESGCCGTALGDLTASVFDSECHCQPVITRTRPPVPTDAPIHAQSTR